MPPAVHIRDEDLRFVLPPARLSQTAAAFARDGYVRIEPALAPKAAEALYHHLANEVEWWRAVNQGDRTWDLGPDSIAAMSGEKETEFLSLVHQGAREGFQFLFDSMRVSDDPAERRKRGLLADRLVQGLNHANSVDTFRAITGDASARMVDGQATRYLPGHFLTGHDDDIEGKDRIAAWVLNLTPCWRSEWGGLLQFHDEAGDVSRALAPRFNALHLFRVPQPHSVSFVAPFAGAPRYSLTGWVRA
jgi:SM-20-related protein